MCLISLSTSPVQLLSLIINLTTNMQLIWSGIHLSSGEALCQDKQVSYSYPKKVCLVKVATESFQDGGVVVGEVLESKFPGYVSFCCSCRVQSGVLHQI